MHSDLVSQTYIPISDNTNDTFFWKEREDENFTTKSAYNLFIKLSETNLSISNFDHNWIWKAQCHNKLKTFLWLLVHQRLPIATILYQRNIIASSNYPHCGIEENINLIFFQCPMNITIWWVINISTSASTTLDWIKNLYLYNNH